MSSKVPVKVIRSTFKKKDFKANTNVKVKPDPHKISIASVEGENDVPESYITIWGKNTSSYNISVDRILTVDGKFQRSKEAGSTDATLLVLKFNFISTGISGDHPLSFVRALLEFAGKNNTDPRPEILAWSPFNVTENGDKTTVEISDTGSVTLGSSSALNGTTVTPSATIGRTQKWSEQFHSEYSAYLIKEQDKATGICWNMRQNEMVNITVPAFYAHVLFKRPSNAPYRIKLDLNASRFRFSQFWKHMIDKIDFLGWLSDASNCEMTPGDKKITRHGEGDDIFKDIDPEHLETVLDKSDSSKVDDDDVKQPSFTDPASPSTDTKTTAPSTGMVTITAPGTDTVLITPGAITSTISGMAIPTRTVPKITTTAPKTTTTEITAPTTPTMNNTSELKTGDATGQPSGDVVVLPVAERLLMLETRQTMVDFRLAMQDTVITQLRTQVEAQTQKVSLK